jgi:hypothetical protein
MPPDENGLPFVGQYFAVRSGKALILTEPGLGPDARISAGRDGRGGTGAGRVLT